MTKIDDLLDAADFPERRVAICLKGTLRQKWEDAQATLDELNDAVEATRDPAGKISAAAGLVRDRRKAAEAVRAVEAEMADQSITFVIRGRSFADYNATLLKHPPRQGNASDSAHGFNTETFHVANVRASLVEPELSDDQWAKLVARLTDRQFDQLARAAIEVNRTEDGSVPFSSTASALIRESGATSR